MLFKVTTTASNTDGMAVRECSMHWIALLCRTSPSCDYQEEAAKPGSFGVRSTPQLML
jgi:hypothetical protein